MLKRHLKCNKLKTGSSFKYINQKMNIMKSITKLMTGLSILLLSFSLNATPVNLTINPDGVKEEIESLLKAPNFKIDKNTTTMVTFMLNKKNEVLVINVETDNKSIERYIKNSLNYKKLKTNTTKKLFKIPVKINVR